MVLSLVTTLEDDPQTRSGRFKDDSAGRDFSCSLNGAANGL